ncbi:hypothetical protein BBJ28_00008329 [Nothophytophthora sp. Chile5]|nr:hypothetical protein BBJ28_00008329 [Nothophytophthora sp. Chile5]
MSAEEMAQLRAVLGTSDKHTQSFLQPLLPLRGVQELLLTFVRDPTRRFEDWVWDPQVRQTLMRMREAEPQAHHEGENLDKWYTRAAEERLATMALQNADDATSPEFLEEADAAQRDGKAKFKKKNFYAARNAFQKSIDSLLKHQQSEYYGKTVPVAEWHDLDLCERYVTLCNNVAICGIKLKDLAIINQYAAKALAVDETSSKALYALAKLRLLEHRYAEAHAVVDKALKFHPDNQQFLNFSKEIDAAECKQAKQQEDLAAMKTKQQEVASESTGKSATVPTEEQWKAERLKRGEAVPLPSREDDMFAAARLNVYFMQIKQQMRAAIKPLHNSEMGEDPLFECSIANGTTGAVLATDIQGASKKLAKNTACKIAIEKLWQDKQAAGKLVAEDLVYLEKFERAEATGQSLTAAPAQPEVQQSMPDDLSQLPTRLTCLERQLDPVALLNQLQQRHKLSVRFDIEDVSPNKEVTEFRCTGFLNGEQIAVASAISKKKARTEVAKQVVDAAFEKNILMIWDGPTDEKGEAGTREGEEHDHDMKDQTPAHGG